MRTTIAAAFVLATLLAGCTSDEPRSGADATATAAASSDAATNTPRSAAAATPPAPPRAAASFISAGGFGVAVRDACEDGARTGDAWPDGTEVTLAQVGTGACDGWTLVLSGGGSWVRDEYLASDPPAGVAAVPSSGTTQPPSSGGGGSQPASQPRPVTTVAASPRLEFTTLQGASMTSDDLLGMAYLRGGDSGFLYLGLITRDRAHAKSVYNSVGTYGSKTSEPSVRNPEGVHGIAYTGDIYHPYFNSAFSAYNAQATSPPSIVLDDVVVAFLSTNGATGAIHPDTLFFHLGCP